MRGKKKANHLVVLILLSLLLSLYGCEAKSDSMKEELQSLETSDGSKDAGKGEADGLKKQLHIPEEIYLKALSDDGKNGYYVDCKVDAPINTSPAVYQQKQIPFSKETIVKKAESLFDSGKFSYIKPLDCYTLDELNEEGTKIQNKLGKSEETQAQDYFWNRSNDIAFYKKFFKETEVKEFQEGGFTEGAEIAFYDKVMIMQGKIGGEDYQLLAYTSEGHNYLKLCRQNRGYGLTQGINYFGYTFKQLDEEGNVIEDVEELEDYSIEERALYRMPTDDDEPVQVKKQSGENVCSYSEEEAGRLALQYAALLGDTDMTIARTNWCYEDRGHKPSSEEEGQEFLSPPIGYAFYLQRQYGELSCNESNFWWREVTGAKNKERAAQADPSGIVAEQESYRVVVTDEGVVFVDTIEPWYEVTKTLSDSTGLMDFADVEELAQEYLEEKVKRDSKAGVGVTVTKITEVTLRYVTVLYDGEYTLIPCWFFNANVWGGRATKMVINAIDGSRVFLAAMP